MVSCIRIRKVHQTYRETYHHRFGARIRSHFWCLLPVQVRTNEQTYRETYREVRHGYCGTDDEAAKIQKAVFLKLNARVTSLEAKRMYHRTALPFQHHIYANHIVQRMYHRHCTAIHDFGRLIYPRTRRTLPSSPRQLCPHPWIFEYIQESVDTWGSFPCMARCVFVPVPLRIAPDRGGKVGSKDEEATWPGDGTMHTCGTRQLGREKCEGESLGFRF